MYWFYPSNRKVFDIVTCLNEHDEVDLPCIPDINFNVGDTIFIYVAVPFSQIIYQMEVTELFLSPDFVNINRWMRYAGRGIEVRGGAWFRMKYVDNATQGHAPLQPHGLHDNIGLKVASYTYPLSKERIKYILKEIKASKENHG